MFKNLSEFRSFLFCLYMTYQCSITKNVPPFFSFFIYNSKLLKPLDLTWFNYLFLSANKSKHRSLICHELYTKLNTGYLFLQDVNIVYNPNYLPWLRLTIRNYEILSFRNDQPMTSLTASKLSMFIHWIY